MILALMMIAILFIPPTPVKAMGNSNISKILSEEYLKLHLSKFYCLGYGVSILKERYFPFYTKDVDDFLNSSNKAGELIITRWNIIFLKDSFFDSFRHKRYINLSQNQIYFLPGSFFLAENLQTLDLSFNRLSNLPLSFSKLTKIKRLNLSHNNFTVFPPEILALTTLEKLDISSNPLSKLPKSIGNLRRLLKLDLSGTQMATTSVKLRALFFPHAIKEITLPIRLCAPK